MPRLVTFGTMPTTAPEGNRWRIRFPQLARLDVGTQEGMVSRWLHSEGGNVRELPRTISMQYRDDAGHLGAVPVGSLWSVTIDAETGLLSGEGWVVDTPDGALAAALVRAKALHHNSIDLADIPSDGIRIVEHGDWWDDDFRVDVHFDAWSLGKTTLVALPAHANARGEMADEITAALASDETLVVDCLSVLTAHSAVEITASALALPKFDYFYRPEPDTPTPISVELAGDDGWIQLYGHLAQWGKPHAGYDGRVVYPPRPTKAYREFNRPGPYTDRGRVETGPITLFGGHVSLADAANDPKNAWADVRVVEGRFGPWLSGVVRPHVAADDVATYIARASQISGHWKGSDLMMIVSCNTPGFGIDGFGYDLADDEIAASFMSTSPSTPLVLPAELLSMTPLDREVVAEFVGMLRERRASGQTPAVQAGVATATATEPEAQPTFDVAAARRRREREMALELEHG